MEVQILSSAKIARECFYLPEAKNDWDWGRSEGVQILSSARIAREFPIPRSGKAIGAGGLEGGANPRSEGAQSGREYSACQIHSSAQRPRLDFSYARLGTFRGI